MEQAKKIQRRQSGFQIEDLPYLIRQLKKFLMIILLCAGIAGPLGYVASRMLAKTTYTASVTMAVVPRSSIPSLQSDHYTELAVTRCVNLMSSGMFREEIEKEFGSLPGSISVRQITETNLLKMSAQAGSGKDALRLLKAGLKTYPKVTDYLNYPFLIRSIETVSGDNIIRNVNNHSRWPFLAMAAVMAAGFGLVLLQVMMTDLVHSEKKAEQLVEVPLIGKLSYVKKKRKHESILVNSFNNDIYYTEEIDRLTTSVQERLTEAEAKSFLVTSCAENEGKSTVAANVAINLANRGYRVCLVDADMRKPAISLIFEKECKVNASISSVLSGKCSIDEIKVNFTKGLDLCLQGQSTGDSDHLLEGSNRLKEMIESLKTEYDYVIVDTPPIGIVRDAELVSSAVDASVLVFCEDEIHAVELNDFTDLLENAGSKVIGCVMNKSRTQNQFNRKQGYGKYYHHSTVER